MTEVVFNNLSRSANLLDCKTANLISLLVELVTPLENLMIEIWDCKREGLTIYSIQNKPYP